VRQLVGPPDPRPDPPLEEVMREMFSAQRDGARDRAAP